MSAPKKADAREVLLATGQNITAVPPSGSDMVFIHALLCQVALPRKKVAEREFMRRCGKAWVYVQAGNLDLGCGPVPQPVPYGVQPRGWRQLFLSDATSISFGSFPLLSGPPLVSLA